MKARAYMARLGQVFQLEASAFRLPPALRRASFTSLPSRWIATIRGARRIDWQGRPYHFETRFEPILMHVHQALVGELVKAGALPPRPTILDVGANTGQFGTSVLIVRPHAKIDSLEPNPACRALLEENARDDAGGESTSPA